jgi:hypothetical protein
LATRRRSDPGKLASAARLRSETTLPINWIAARVQIRTAKGAKPVLPHLAQSQAQRKTARALEPCAQFVFQSTVDSFPARHQWRGYPMSILPPSAGCSGRAWACSRVLRPLHQCMILMHLADVG